ncbi:TIGR02221 family CRISPR-associated protein [Spirochaetia bacterium 38H-sp]|uniref:TIGR02221 family CRISPR-associated protein n=1 Tax=Rarispira pelagica TaxID=3141764 RepID=A0ABU9U8L8_9SPIR
MAICFLTFLGTGNYEKVRYQCPDNSIIKTAYAQIAIINTYKDELKDKNSKVIVFVTKEARSRHWDTETGLNRELEEYIPADKIFAVDISSVIDEQSVWQLFDNIFNSIPYGSDILLDITHAFRSIPMLGLVIINYARIVKNIDIKGIYYGAYDRELTEPYKIIELTQVDRLLQWSNAVNSYANTGNAYHIDLLANQIMKNIKTDLEKMQAASERSLAHSLKKIWPILSTCRIKEIINGRVFIDIKKKIEELHNQDVSYIKPLSTLHSQIEDTILDFAPDSIGNILLAVRLCIKYDLIQQAITLLQEGLITIILYNIDIDYNARNNREAVNRFFTYLAKPDTNNTHPKEEEPYKETGKELDKHEYIKKFIKPCNWLKDLRNDINHAGLTEQKINPETFMTNIKKIFRDILEVLSTEKHIKNMQLVEVANKILREQ